MPDPPGSGNDEEFQRLLGLTERGMGAVQDMIAVLRESDRAMTAMLQRIRQLEQLVWTDVLTGLLNRRGLEEQIEREEALARRYGTPVAIAAMDIDGLAAVNAAHGASGGDALLRAVGGAVRTAARDSDLVARFDGDTFAALLPSADTAGAQVFLERVRSTARYAQLPDGAIVPIRLSTGVATRDETGSILTALDLASQRLIVDKKRQ